MQYKRCVCAHVLFNACPATTHQLSNCRCMSCRKVTKMYHYFQKNAVNSLISKNARRQVVHYSYCYYLLNKSMKCGSLHVGGKWPYIGI